VNAQRLRPDQVDYVLNGVDVTLNANEGDAELARLAIACEHTPLNPALQVGRGMLLDALGRKVEAIDALEAATEMAPDAVVPLRLLSKLLARSGPLDYAEKVMWRLCTLDPGNRHESNNHAAVLMKMHRFAEARVILLENLKRHGPSENVLCNLANTTACLGEQDEAANIARQAIEREPSAVLPRRALCSVLPYCDGVSGTMLLKAMQDCSAVLSRTPRSECENSPEQSRPLIVGLLSGSLRSHPVGWLTVAGFEALDLDQFTLVCFAQNTSPKDPMTRRFRAAARDWIEIDSLSDIALTDLARAMKIDILIDLGGYGEAARMSACANRLAPVQIKWVGMQSHSSGLAEMDWFLTDRWETPEGFERFYSERLLRLPEGYVCYSPPPHAPDVVETPALKNGFVTFGCFNNLAKITPRVMRTWANILYRVPSGRLILKTHQLSDAPTANRLRANFAELGISVDRIELRGSSGHRSFMGEYGDVDIVLDPFPYSGGLTTCEALWMGVPTVTLPGEIFASRHSTSHLSNAGLADWVTASVDDYIEMAVARASDPASLAHLRSGLREQVRRSPLCDAPRFGRSLGAALREAWRAWCLERGTATACLPSAA
jgi:predicted O-linked N-acetylglucosamine transferase (SPINDLY family)